MWTANSHLDTSIPIHSRSTSTLPHSVSDTLPPKAHRLDSHTPRPSLQAETPIPSATRIPRTNPTLASTDDLYLPTCEVYDLKPLRKKRHKPTPLQYHPDFTTGGDVALICPSGKGQLGFIVKSVNLRTTCELFSTLGDPSQPLETDGRVYLDDPAPEVHTFLTYLHTTSPQHYTLPQCLSINHLLTRYNAYPAAKLPLQDYIYRNASTLVASLGPSPIKTILLGLLSLAVEFKLTEIWHMVLLNIKGGWWRAPLDPSLMTLAEKGILGRSALNALRYLAFFGEGGTWSEVELCEVARDANGLFFIIRRSGGQQMVYSDTAL